MWGFRDRKRFRKSAAVIIACILLTGTALASTLGEELHSAGAEIAEGTRLANGVFWNTAYSDRLTENYIEYTPSTAVTPVVVYGSKVLNYGSFSSMAALLERRGQHVIGGINGDYYIMANYQPLGVVITDGILRSSDGGFNAVGFRADGTAVMGKPDLKLSFNIRGNDYQIFSVNKLRLSGYVTLFTEDFAVSTKNTEPGIDVVLSVKDGGSLRVNSNLTFTVDSIHESKGDFAIPAGKMILSASANTDAWRLGAIKSLVPGDEITISCGSWDSSWNDVRYAVGCFQKLVTSGAPESGLDNTKNPRTAVGIKADGTVILYTIDGRQPGYSAGVGAAQVAERLIELGCVEAGLMDGGGSTSLNALYIGNESLAQINSPSDGSQRSVTDYIMLVTTTGATGIPARLGVYPFDAVLLAGASQSFTVKAADSGGYPAYVPAELEYRTENGLGSVSASGLFSAGMTGGSETIVVSGENASGFATVTIVDTPHEISIYNENGWAKVTSLSLSSGDTVNLAASALYNMMTLKSSDSCFTWETVGGIGNIDADGEFTAADVDAKGEILITAGDKTVTVPVIVRWKNPFTDINDTQWFYSNVQYVYANKLFTGMTVTEFEPYGTMTRAMLVTVLSRMSGINAEDYKSAVFPDVDLGKWYGSSVAWAAENGIIEGYDDGNFYPDASITREQLCVLLLRYADYVGKELPKARESGDFADSERISAYALSAVDECYRGGIVEGRGNGIFDPKANAMRCEVAALLQRFIEKIA